MDLKSSYSKYHPNPTELEELIQEFRKRIKDSKFPFTPRTDETFLLKFLRIRNYSLDNAFRTLKNYYANVERNYDLVDGVRPSDFEYVFRDGPVKCIKHRHNGRRIGIASMKWKPKEMPLHHVQVTAVMLIEYLGLESETQDNGIIFVLDFKDLSFEHVWLLSPKEIKRCLYGQDGLPLKIAEIHIVHPPPLFWTLFAISRRFLKEKIRKRFYFHSNFESLHNFIDPSICPESIGGKLSDEEAHDIAFIDEILRKDIPYNDMWNGDQLKTEIIKTNKIERL